MARVLTPPVLLRAARRRYPERQRREPRCAPLQKNDTNSGRPWIRRTCFPQTGAALLPLWLLLRLCRRSRPFPPRESVRAAMALPSGLPASRHELPRHIQRVLESQPVVRILARALRPEPLAPLSQIRSVPSREVPRSCSSRSEEHTSELQSR